MHKKKLLSKAMLVFSDKKSIIKDIVQNKKTNRIKEVIF